MTAPRPDVPLSAAATDLLTSRQAPGRWALPPWFRHALRWQRGPLPRQAMLRGALGGLPLLAAVLGGVPTLGVPAALGAMFAGVNDRPGSRRSSLHRIGLPALAGATGLLAGSLAQAAAPSDAVVVAGLALVALVSGAISAVGPTASACGTQLLITTAIGWGMPLPESAGVRALCFAGGALWLLALRFALPSARPAARHRDDAEAQPFLLDGERAAVADVYDAIGALLGATGEAERVSRRAALSAALDRAQDALAGPALRGGALGAAERRLRAQYTAALPLTEAATALTWEDVRDRGLSTAQAANPARLRLGPQRLAAAVRTGVPCGPLPAPGRATAALRALDDALLGAAQAFGTPPDGTSGRRPARGAARRAVRSARRLLADRGRASRGGLRTACSAAGREYGLRVAVSTAAATGVALALHPAHWYWLPATAAFLVKPDLGPLASRTLNRALGTFLGAGAFAGLSALLALGPAPAVCAALTAALAGALVPASLRHFAAQTAVITLLVLALVSLGGGTGLVANRITDTLLACAIVLLVGHLPLPGLNGRTLAARTGRAEAAARDYLAHVLAPAPASAPASGERLALRRAALRRAAYRALADARAAADLTAAELPPTLARPGTAARPLLDALEQLVDTTTAAAVQRAYGADALSPRQQADLLALLSRLPKAG